MQEVQIDAVPMDRLAQLLEADRVSQAAEHAARTGPAGPTHRLERQRHRVRRRRRRDAPDPAGLRPRRTGRHALARPGRTPGFFRFTKRLHNRLHGVAGDGGPIGDDERALYERVLAENLSALRTTVRPGDIVLLHDLQTAGLAKGLRDLGAHPCGAATSVATPQPEHRGGLGVPPALRRAGRGTASSPAGPTPPW